MTVRDHVDQYCVQWGVHHEMDKGIHRTIFSNTKKKDKVKTEKPTTTTKKVEKKLDPWTEGQTG